MTDGFEKMINELEEMQQKAHELSKQTEVPIVEILNDQFMKENTDFQSFESFLEAGKFDINDFENIEDQVMDEFVTKHSKFNSWNDLWDQAQESWLADQLGF